VAAIGVATDGAVDIQRRAAGGAGDLWLAIGNSTPRTLHGPLFPGAREQWQGARLRHNAQQCKHVFGQPMGGSLHSLSRRWDMRTGMMNRDSVSAQGNAVVGRGPKRIFIGMPPRAGLPQQ
jgi:hypothetical protein